MEALAPLSIFFSAIEKDCRISTLHISVYASLLQFRMDRGLVNPIEAYSFEIMCLARICNIKTYLKCMRELNQYGYIKYEPSLKKNEASRIYFFE
jgi:hypothetical protein